MSTNTALSSTETWSLLALSISCLAVLAQTLHGDGAPLIASLGFSGLAFALTYALIRWLGDVFMKAGLKGKDMSKVRKVEMYGTSGLFFAHVDL
jgi:UDP-N-acetylglucosamine--dolichyl-phosphate N-acetylglucosaminephosphotransferase